MCEKSSIAVSEFVTESTEQDTYTYKLQRCRLFYCAKLLSASVVVLTEKVGWVGTGECGNYVETTICQPLITILLQQQNKSPLHTT